MKAIYAGSFDPITSGHVEIIERASKMYGNVTVLMAINPEKTYMFSLSERLELLKIATKNLNNVTIDCTKDLVVNYAKMHDVGVLIRGLRAISDFDYEFQMAITNNTLEKNIETIFLMSNPIHSFLSSSIVREIFIRNGDYNKFVPQEVANYLKEIKKNRFL